jgi:Ca2+/Na+ antiporter
MLKNILNLRNKHEIEIKFTIFVFITHFTVFGLFLSKYRLPDVIEFLIVCVLYCLWVLYFIFICKDPKIIEKLKTKILNLFYW